MKRVLVRHGAFRFFASVLATSPTSALLDGAVSLAIPTSTDASSHQTDFVSPLATSVTIASTGRRPSSPT